MRSNSKKMDDIVKFGKYKGKTVRELKKDKQYCNWLVSTSAKEPTSFIAYFVNKYIKKRNPSGKKESELIEDELEYSMNQPIHLGALNTYTEEYVYPRIANTDSEYTCLECGEDVCIGDDGFEHVYTSTTCNYYSKPSDDQICRDGKMLLQQLKREGKTVLQAGKCCECKCVYSEDFVYPKDETHITTYYMYRLNYKANYYSRDEHRIICGNFKRCTVCEGRHCVKEKQMEKYVRYTLGQSSFSDFVYNECLMSGKCDCYYCMFQRNDYLQIDRDAGVCVERNKRLMGLFSVYFRDKIPVIHTRNCHIIVYIVDKWE